MAADKKGAARWRQPIVFLDESGFMLQPTVRRTWAPPGHTPILIESARRDRISAIGAFSISPILRRMDFPFQLHRRNIDTSLLIPFLHALHNRFRHRVVLVWDNLSAHYKTAKYFSIRHPSWFRFEYLPPYCPELNPVEGAWSYVKHGCQANFAPTDVDHLYQQTTDSLASLRCNQNLLPGFLEHTKLQI
jgi:transposase